MNDMIDMSRFIEAKSDQLNADDLINITKTIKVTRVTGSDGDQPVSIFYEGDNGKPFKPCKTMRRVLMAVWGRIANDYVGKSMTLYRDDKVTFGGLETGGVRISHMSDIDKETIVVVMKSKGKKAGLKILPLRIEQQRPRMTAREWVEDHLVKIQAAPDEKALLNLAHESAGDRDRLAASEKMRPHFDRIVAAERAKMSSFTDQPANGHSSPADAAEPSNQSDEQAAFDSMEDRW